jgi:hypothetical protein
MNGTSCDISGNSSVSPRIGDSVSSSIRGVGCIGVVGALLGAEETVDILGVPTWIDIGIFNPRPVVDSVFVVFWEGSGMFVVVVAAAAAALVALVRSASATFSAVNSGTAGIGLEGFDCLPNVIIFGCARTATGTGAAAMMAVDL